MTLVCRDVTVGGPGAHVLDAVKIELGRGDWLLVLGPNGGGKSTLAGCVSGRVRPSAGRIEYDGSDVTAMRTCDRVALGIVEVTEGRNLFPTMQVREHLTMAHRAGEWTLDEIDRLFPELARRSTNLAYSLSGGEQQMLAIARALVCQPKLLVLDEPTTGLAPLLRRRVNDALQKVAARGTTILQFEQLLPAEAMRERALGAVIRGKYRRLGRVAEFDRSALFELYVEGFPRSSDIDRSTQDA